MLTQIFELKAEKVLFEHIGKKLEEVCLNEYAGGFQDEELRISATALNRIDNQDIKKSIASYIKYASPFYGYGLYRLFFAFVAINIVMMLCHVSQALYKSSSAAIVENLVDLNLHVIDMWNTHSVMETALNSYLLWDDQAMILNKKPSEVYKIYAAYFKDTIIDKFDKLQSADLGKFSDTYKGFFGSYSLCKGLKEYNQHTFLKCGEGQSSFVDQNIIIFLKSLASIYDEVFDLKTLQRDKPGITKELLSNPKFKVAQAYSLVSVIFSDLYYMIILPLSQVLEQYIWPNKISAVNGRVAETNKELQVYCWTFIPAFLIYLWACWYFVLKPFLYTMTCYWSTLRLIPLGLIEKNPILQHHFGKVEAGTKKLVQF